MLWESGVPVPYPVQLWGTELLMEFLSEDDESAAPRLVQVNPNPDELHDLWEQLVAALMSLAALGLTHGDLSPYNILVHRGRLMLIDLPQIVDVIANPNGSDFLERDVRNVSGWFATRGLPAHIADPGALLEALRYEANIA
jgi:RIO kinase 1